MDHNVFVQLVGEFIQLINKWERAEPTQRLDVIVRARLLHCEYRDLMTIFSEPPLAAEQPGFIPGSAKARRPRQVQISLRKCPPRDDGQLRRTASHIAFRNTGR